MRFFTLEWWRGDCDDAAEVFARYNAHFSSIVPKLPEALVDFQSRFTLHDSEVKRITCDFLKKEVDLEFDGWDQSLSYPVRYFLKFSGVTAFGQDFPKGKDFDSELGDLGYWEFALVPEGVEMQMLFVSSAEFRIVFSGFAFQHVGTKA
jgi:hypothetical protein